MKQTFNLRQRSAEFLATTPCPMRERVSRLVGTGKGLLFALFLFFGLGVSQSAWAWDLKGNMYFNNSSKNWSNVSWVVGNDSWSQGYKFSQLSDTKLYYKWVDYSGYGDCYFVNGSETTGQSKKPWDVVSGYSSANRLQPYKDDYKDSKRWYFAGGTDKATEGVPSYDATIEVQSRNSTGNYTTLSSNAPATVKLKGTHMNGDAATGRNTITWPEKTYGTVITGKVTLTYESLNSNYQFDGWYVGSTQKGTGSSYEYYQSAATTVVAKFTRIKYTVTLNQESGTGGTTSTTATYNSAMPSITVPTRTGYTFGGYYTSTGGSGTKYYNADGTSAKTCDLTADIELHAKWTANTNTAYKVKHYQQNIADDQYTLYETENKTGTTETSVTPAVKSYTGFTAPSTQTKTIAADGSMVVEYQYARSKHTLSWDFDGGSATSEDYTHAGDIKYGATVTAPTLTKTGYDWNNWNTAVVSPMPDADKSYTAQWTIHNYSITYSPEVAVHCTYTTAPTSADYNSEVNFEFTPEPNYVIGSVTAVDATSHSVTVTKTSENHYQIAHMPASNITITVTAALSSLTVTYGVHSSGNGSVAGAIGGAAIGASPATVAAASVVVFTATPNDHYEVEGWYTNSACTEGKSDAGQLTHSVTMDANKTVYVKFVDHKYDVKVTHQYYQNNGSTKIDSCTTNETFDDQLGAATGYTIDASSKIKVGFYHTKWVLNTNASVVCNSKTTTTTNKTATIDGSTHKSSTLVLTSGYSTSGEVVNVLDRWREYERTLDVFANHGTIQGDSADLEGIGVYTAKTVVALPSTGYKFSDWIISPTSSDYTINLATPAVASTEVRVSSDVKTNKSKAGSITANFTPIIYSIKYNTNGGSAIADGSYTIETATFALPTTSTKTGYDFEGWYTESTLVNKVTEIALGSYGNKEYWAKWTPHTYQVEFAGNGATSSPMDNQAFTYDVAQYLTSNTYGRVYQVTFTNGGSIAPINATYTFNGWLGENSQSYTDGQSVSNLTSENNDVFTMTAQWTGGSITLPTPTKVGSVFDGWYDGDNRVGGAGDTYTPGAVKELSARWTAVYAYIEGRTKVKDASGNETVINAVTEPWNLGLKDIPMEFSSTDGVYYLNTHCTTKELASYINNKESFIRVGVATGAEGAVTCYSVANATDFLFTDVNKGKGLNTTNNSSFYFRNVENYESGAFARRNPVMYRFNPADSEHSNQPYFSYCAPLLTMYYNNTTANVATMTGYSIALANCSTAVDGLTSQTVTYQYKKGTGAWTNMSADLVLEEGEYTLRAVAFGNNDFGQHVDSVKSNTIAVTVTTPAVSAQVTHVNGNAGNIIRINDSFTIKHTVTGVPTGQAVQVCYHWKTKPAGSQITKDVFTAVGGDQPNSVWTTIDVAGDYEIEVSVSTLACEQSSAAGYIKWMTYTLPIHVKGDEIVVYAKMDKGITDWNKKYVYHWKSGQPVPYEWPGQEMTYLGKDSVDYEWYSKAITNYKTYAGGNLLFNDSTKRYGQYQSNNVDMPSDDEFYFIKTAIEGSKRNVATEPHIDVTRRVVLMTDTTALYQYVTIELEGKGVFFANREEMKYTYTITGRPTGSGATLNAKNQFTPDKYGDYTVTIRCEAGTLNAENSFILHVRANPLTLTASVGAESTIGTATTVTVSADQSLPGTKTFTVIEPGSNSPITFSTKSTVAKSVTSDSYTMLSSGMYIFGVVVVNDGKIAGKAQYTVTVAPKKYYIKHPFKNTASVKPEDWVWKELTYSEIDGAYKYSGDDAYYHANKVANINTSASGTNLKEYKIANPDALEDNTKCVFVYDLTLDSVTVYSLTKRLYRIKSVCQDNEYFSNAVTYDDGNPSLTQKVSFFAQKDGALVWQSRETAADAWVDGTAITTTASASGIYTAEPTKLQTEFTLTPYTDTLTVFSQVVTVNNSEHSPTALKGTLTEFTKKSSSEYYNHYWVRYIESGTQAMATVGNKINNCIAATLPYYQMPASGNVRFAYDNTTNHFSRTFLSGSGDQNFLRVYGQHLDTVVPNTVPAQYLPIDALNNSKKFDDGSDWIYTAKASGEVSASNSVTAILTTKYNGMNRWVLAESGLEADPDAEQVVLSKDAASAGRYDLTLIYDYKTNRLTAGAQPQPGTEVSDTMVIDQLILTREGDGSATQFTLAEKAKLIVVDRMTVEFDVTKDMYDAWADEGKFPGYKVMYFWFSVPYECHINEIYGLGVYGEKFEIQRYRGDLRAAGTAGSSTGTSAWRKLKATATMEANRGYVIAMRVAASDFKSATVGGVKTSVIRLYFPSVGKVELTHEVKTVLAEYENTKTTNLHWNWNIMGCPLVKDGNNLIVDSLESAELNYIYVWTWGGGARTYEPWSVDETTLQSTHSYMVQAKGNVYWAYPSKASAPGRYLEAAQFASADSYGKLNIRLNIKRNDQLLDKTYIMYREDGDRNEYEMGRDLEKIVNSGVTQMYATANNNLAAICVNSEDKEMIPLTVIANENGEYSFSINRQLNSNLEPTIYDAQTGRYYNLALDEFVVDLNKGTYTGRFYFVLKVPGVVTGLDELNSNNYQEGVHKVMRNGQLYIIRDNEIHDATGRLVK